MADNLQSFEAGVHGVSLGGAKRTAIMVENLRAVLIMREGGFNMIIRRSWMRLLLPHQHAAGLVTSDNYEYMRFEPSYPSMRQGVKRRLHHSVMAIVHVSLC